MGAGGEHMGALNMGVWLRVHLKGGLSGLVCTWKLSVPGVLEVVPEVVLKLSHT